MPTVTQVNDLKINKLTKAQYDEAVQSGVIGENEISIITDLDAGQIIQVDVLPTASATEEGKIYQYIGVTDANYTNGYFYKCVSDGQSPATYSWENIEVQPAGDSLPSQTGNAGKFLTTDGTNANWGDALINNSPTNDKLVIGDGATAIDPSIQSIVVVGAHATGNDHYATVIGTRSSAIYMGTSIGSGARSSFGSIAIGSSATASASHCMQISISGGTGISKTNSDANTVKISNENGNFEIMSADGTIPEARLADTTSATSGQVLQLDSNNNAVWKNIISTPSIIPTLLSNSWTENPTTHEITQTVSVTGVTLTNLVMVGPTPVSAEDYNDSDVICIAQGVDTLTFKCATIPSVDLTLNVLCF